MRLNKIKRASLVNAQRVYNSLKLINRHALVLVPLLALTFAIIAGWVATEYGTQYLFRDNEPRDLGQYFRLCGHNIPCVLTSARFYTALYATSLMGMVWTLFVLIQRRDDDRDDRHPIDEFEPVLPGVVLLGFVMELAVLANRSDSEDPYAVLVLSGLGFVAGLLFVGLVTWLGMLLSRRIRCHQVWTFLGLSICVGLAVSLMPLVTPSKAIFIALAFVAILYCAFAIARAQYRLLLAAVIILVLIIGTGLPTFKYRFNGLERYYEAWPQQQSAPSAKEAEARASRIPVQAALDAWLRQPDVARRKKLVIVSASGGAYRATFWTAKVLDTLVERLPGFDRAVRLMTGASGGMVGLAYFVASREPPEPCAGAKPSPGIARIEAQRTAKIEERLVRDLEQRGKQIWLANSHTDSLTPVVQRMIGNDVPKAFLPFINHDNRGQALEDEWSTLDVTFCELESGERSGRRPSLIVSPYLVDWARPMFISNLNLEGILNLGGKVDPSFAEEFFWHFPSARREFKLATAVRMSATFPLISPAIRLPLHDRPRVVDAGYFDNYGIVAAATFLRHDLVRNFVRDNDLDVVLVRIMAFQDKQIDTRANTDDNTTWLGQVGDWLARLLEPWSSPLEGALAARETNGRFANALLLEDLKRSYQGRFHDFEFTYQASDGSFSWHIQAEELKKMASGMSAPRNQEKLRQLEDLWAGKPRP
jgi:hypothetical protein